MNTCVLVNVKLTLVVGMLINNLKVINLIYFTLHWTCVVALHELTVEEVTELVDETNSSDYESNSDVQIKVTEAWWADCVAKPACIAIEQQRNSTQLVMRWVKSLEVLSDGRDCRWEVDPGCP